MISEVTTAIEHFQGLRTDVSFAPEAYAERMALYEQAMSTTMRLLATGAFFSDGVEHDRLWVRGIELLATRTQQQAGLTVLIDMQQFPTLLALYALGLGAVAADRIDSIARVLAEVAVRDGSERRPVAVAAASWRVLNVDCVKQSLSELERRKTPISDHLLKLVGPVASNIVGSQEQLEDLFDEVEYLMGIACIAGGRRGGPQGRGVWRSEYSDRAPGALIKRHGQVLVASGLFDSEEKLTQVCATYDEQLRSSPIHSMW